MNSRPTHTFAGVGMKTEANMMNPALASVRGAKRRARDPNKDPTTMPKLLTHPPSSDNTHALLLEACKLLAEFSDVFDDSDFRDVGSPDLFEWWGENNPWKPKPRRKLRPGEKITIIDKTTGKRT